MSPKLEQSLLICGLKKTPAGTGLDWRESGGDFWGSLSWPRLDRQEGFQPLAKVTGLGGVSVRPNYHRTFEVKQDLARCLVKCQKLDHKIAQLQAVIR